MTRKAIALTMLIAAIGVLGYSTTAARMWSPATETGGGAAVTVPAISIHVPRFATRAPAGGRMAANPSAPAGGDFHWGDAGLGAGAVLVLVAAVLAAGLGPARRSGGRRRLPGTAARS